MKPSPLWQPGGIRPMLAHTAGEPFDHPDWTFEIKWDGYRCLAFIGGDGTIFLQSRGGNNLGRRFSPLLPLAEGWDRPVILDGEITAFRRGRPDFSALGPARRFTGPDPGAAHDGVQLKYVAFDLLHADGIDLINEPLFRRGALLARLVDDAAGRARSLIGLSEPVGGKGRDLFRGAAALGLEGIVAKRRGSLYSPGRRSRDWLKVRNVRRGCFVIGGVSAGRIGGFGSLLLGVWDGADPARPLMYIGKVGTGFTEERAAAVLNTLHPRAESPFMGGSGEGQEPGAAETEVIFVEPRIVCTVEYLSWTADGLLRHAVFRGLAKGKEPHMCRLPAQHPQSRSEAPTAATGAAAAWGGRNDGSLSASVDGRHVRLTNLDRLLWPTDGITKADLIKYFIAVAPWMSPHLTGRPLVFTRYPEGIESPGFYQKNMPDYAPDWARRVSRGTESPDRAVLAWLGNQAVIEIHPWTSRANRPGNPDYVLIDLDPAEGTGFKEAVEVARVLRQALSALGLKGFPKTSGLTGLHVYVPVVPRYSYAETADFARRLGVVLFHELPGLVTLERSVARRKGRVYVDYLQNGRGKTLAGVYSPRAHPGAPVSFPVAWEELPDIDPGEFTLRNVPGLLDRRGDLFGPLLDPERKQTLDKALKAMDDVGI